MNSFYTEKELKNIGLKSYGSNVLISKFARFYNPQNISIGNNSRIDDFCILSAGSKIEIGNFVHIGCYSSLIGLGEIKLGDYSSISGRVSIYSSTDDYSGEFLFNPCVSESLKNVQIAPVILKNYTLIGSGSVILPGVRIQEGAAAGAMSFINRDLDEWTLNAGIPVRFIKRRSKNLLNLL